MAKPGIKTSIPCSETTHRAPAAGRGQAQSAPTKKRVAVIEGDDASPEAVRPTLAVLEALDVDLEWVKPPIGPVAVAEGLPPFPEVARHAVDTSDAVLFGATGAASLDALIYLRWGKSTYANVRPCRYQRGYRSPIKTPDGIDFVIIRENTEGLYFGVEAPLGELAQLMTQSRFSKLRASEAGNGSFAIKVVTVEATARVARFGFELARRRQRSGRAHRVVVASKANVLPRTDGLFVEVCTEVAREYSDIPFESLMVDEVAQRIVLSPQSLGVVITPNLYGDILSDVAAGVLGGVGLAPSGCYGETFAYFESVHGTAPNLAGQNVINPTATILSGAMMLAYLGLANAAMRLETAVRSVYAEGSVLTPDQGGRASTTEFCDAILRRLA